MQIHRNLAYRLAYETATLELELIQAAMQRIQLQKDQMEGQLHSDKTLPFLRIHPSGYPVVACEVPEPAIERTSR